MGFRDDGLKPKLTQEDKEQALALRKHYRHHLPDGYTAEQINRMTPRRILELRYGMTYTEYMGLQDESDMMYSVSGDGGDPDKDKDGLDGPDEDLPF